jgi:hypothetical protein
VAEEMIRTVWLAAGCLVVLGAMAAGKVAKAPATQTTDEKPVAAATVDANLAREPLIKADRLEVTYVRLEKPSQSALQPIDPIVPEVQKMISPVGTNIEPALARSKRHELIGCKFQANCQEGQTRRRFQRRPRRGSFQAKRAD